MGKFPVDALGKLPHIVAMEQLISEIQTFASAQGVTPQKFLRDVIGASWNTWQKWRDGESTPTMAVADRIRTHIADSKPAKTSEDAA